MSCNSFNPGKVWRDTSGKPIQAHGFSLFFNPNDSLYYWYGENKEKSKKGGTIWHWGVRYYVSKDLYHWEDRGLLIPPEPEDLHSPLHPTYQMDRPHILFCERTGKYVAWLKNVGGDISQFMSVMEADRFEGPYRFVRKIYKPLNMDSGDFCLHVDAVTKKAYIWFERPHFELICATLSDDYTETTGEYSAHYQNLYPPLTREAPAYFEHGGKKYLFTSGTSGYYPNPSRVCVFDDYHGEYRDLGDPCIGDKSHTTFNSQISCVLQIPGTEKLIACADRWCPQWWVPKLSRQIISGMERHFAGYTPDRSEKQAIPLPGKEQINPQNTSISR
ncbi:MAG: family 43 glycosylhydrolase, partial [Faecousia sp.]